MTSLIDPKEFTDVVTELRSFFLSKNFYEVHTQNRLSILAACEDPETVASYNYGGNVWPLPQTGQMWLEHELLSNPKAEGFFCVSTSYRAEPHFALFLENHDELKKKWKELMDKGYSCCRPYKHRDGTVSFYTKDTEGNQLEFICYGQSEMSK